ncbi:hypothetical protein [Spirosoma validum]|uniref:Uncharacterized protein n=1 Tax=Spirosoma validum TaxID=2771355 RepID=A0A927B0V0_9BACT|nr:hypothetical protein [Spirosoma validum]MBD2753192.1 hypothetical protein [Spirosoma validum]
MTTARTITPKKVRKFPEYLDFDRLRAEGISHIQALAGQTWTDHNSHDPGITILELLCYALTDLGYRTNLDIRDLLAQPLSSSANITSTVDDNFPTAAHSLSCNPLTILDLRKLLVDTAGVRNAWLSVVGPTDEANPDEPALIIDLETRQLKMIASTSKEEPRIYVNGLYNVLLELDDAYLAQQEANGETATSVTNRILAQVSEKLHAHRNLCEDYLAIRVLRDEKISLCGEIELTTNALPDDVMLNILDRVQEFLSPTISFYTINEMLAKGATTDEIFEGLPLKLKDSFGFIDTKQLENAERRQVIHVSDIYRVLLGIDGITAVKNLRLVNLTNGTNLEGEEWILPLTPDTFRPVLDALKSINSLVLSKRNVVYSIDTDRVLKFFAKKIANRLKVPKKPTELDLPITLGTYRNEPVDERNTSLTDGLGYHFSIQNDLPAVYGTSGVSFPANANTADERQRHAQALQLKGYLLFFDQLLANYLSQLANVRSLFSTKLDPVTDSVLANGSLSDVAFLEKLLPYSVAPVPGNPISRFFSEGERIAKVIDPTTQQRRVFGTPAERDTALIQIIKAFDEDSVDRSFPKNPDNGRFYFQIISQGLHPVVLRSQKTYATEDDAEAALGMVRFLATLESSYLSREKRMAEEHHYTFDWVFRWTADFGQIMRQITESQSDYLRRKNNLFDHLLARFAEDFTDYTLLMFGLNKNSAQPPSAETMARDKARFIEAYPKISRNRSRGFNQHLPPEKYWQWKNSSGLENRLATMLGFNRPANKPTKQLNFFELDEAVRRQFFVHDRQGLTLLQSPQPSRIGELADFQHTIQEAVKSPNAFVPTRCETEHVFGFRMTDQAGCVVAVHPDTYGTPEARDAMLRYTRLVTRDANRLPVDFVPQQKGFYANVLKPDGSPIFRSVAATYTQAEARLMALIIRRTAAHKDYYQPLARSAKGFGFQLRSQPKGTKNANLSDVLATHPNYYSTAEKRNEAIEQTVRFFANNPLRLLIQSTPVRHYWTIPLPKGNQLQSIHLFKTAKQTQAAADRAMTLPKEARTVRIHHHNDDTFSVQLIELRTYPSAQLDERPHTVQVVLAQTQPVATLPEAEQFRDDIQQLPYQYTVQLDTKPAQFYTQLMDNETENEIGLRDVRLFDTADEAEMAFDEVLEAACGGAWLLDDTINNGCAHGFSLQHLNSGDLLATHPSLYDTVGERNDVLTNIQTLSCAHRIRFEAEERSDSWQFELLCPNSEGSLSAILREPAGSTHTTEAESRQFFEEKVRDKLVNFQPDYIDPIGEPGSFSFQLKVNNQILAEHPESYLTDAERNVLKIKIINCLTTTNEAYTQISDVFVCPGDEFPPPDLASRRWRVRDANAPIAVYEQSFATSDEAKKFADQLIRTNRCQTPPYSDLVVGEGATPPDGHWVIRDKTRILWQSPDSYTSAAEARQWFEKTLMRVITASLSLDNYSIKPVIDEQTQIPRFRIDLTDGHQAIAVSELFDSAILAQQGIGLRHDYARLFPFYTTTDGIYFQLYNARNQRVDWRSSTAYPTWWEALDGFMSFTDILGFESHYAPIRDGNKGWQIALIEVLLESTDSFVINPKTTTNPDGPKVSPAEADLKLETDQLDTLGWEQVENFLNRYQATDETRVVRPYIDYTDGCQYRFQLVSDTYALARHLGAFHTNTDREIRRDELFLAWTNRFAASDESKKLLAKILTKVPAFSQTRQPLTNLFVVVESGIYMLGVLDKTTGSRFVFDDDEDQHASEAELVEAVRQLYVALPADLIVDRVDGGRGFEIRIIVGTERYQLAGLTQQHDFPHYEIWESVTSYGKESDLEAGLTRCQNLLSDKTNYSRYQAADQSRTLVLTDPAQVLATHPRRYTTLSLCNQAIKRTRSYVDSEGFHVVEHILLRPRQFLPTAASQLLPIQVREELRKPGLISDFDAYIPGSDPYSMTATVVLPYWSRRFRSVDFRQFFENTLRRETPVHILLNIVWITPGQMQRFEDCLRGWLQEIDQPSSIDFSEQTSSLVDILGKLTNTFPQAILNDCNGTPIILDETTID